MGPAGVGAARLDEAACRSRCRRSPSMAADGRLDELEVLYWVGCAAAFDDAQPEGRPGGRDVPRTRPASGSRSSARRSRAPATRRGGWATTTSSRSSPSGNVETLNRYGMGERTIVTACPHCFNTIGNEYGQLGGSYQIVHHSTYLAELARVRAARDAAGGRRRRDRRPPAGQRHRPRLVLPGPLQRRHRRAAGRAGRRRACRVAEMEKSRQEHVLLRRRRRPDVDGGDARHADQRRADAPGRSRRAPTTVATAARSAW